MLPESMPCAPDIERAVISSLLFEPEHIPSVMHAGGADIFYKPAQIGRAHV